MAELYLNLSGKNRYRITDETGKIISLETAKRKWQAEQKAGNSVDCNLAFSRLVCENFDMDAIKAFYDD